MFWTTILKMQICCFQSELPVSFARVYSYSNGTLQDNSTKGSLACRACCSQEGQRMCMCAWKLPARSDYKYIAPHLQDVVHMGVLRCSERLEIRRLRACCHRLADFGEHAGGPPGQRLGSHLAWGRPAADVQAISSSCNLRRPGTLEVAE